MAVKIGNFSGAETGGLEEVSATGTPTTSSTGVNSGSFSYQLGDGDFIVIDDFVVQSLSPDNNQRLFSFWVYFTDATPSSALDFFSDQDLVGIFITTDGKVGIGDIGGPINDTSAGVVFSDATSHRVDVYCEYGNASDLVEVWVDGTQAVTSTAQNISSVTRTITDGVDFAGSTGVGAMYVDDILSLTGVTAMSDRFSDYEIFAYSHSVTGTTPDAGGLGSAGTALNAGNWQNTVDGNLGTDGEYTASGVYGSVDMDGPNGDGNIDGDSNIKAIKGLANMNRDGGGGSTHYLFLGDSGDGDSPTAFDDDNDWGPITTGDTWYSVTSETVPTASQDIRMGFGTGGAQDIHMNEMWAFILHVPSAGATTPQTVAATCSNVALVVEIPVYTRTIAGSVSAVATFAKIATFARTLAVSSSNLASLATISTFKRTLAVTTSNTASFIKKMFTTITGTVAAVATLTPASLVSQAIAAVGSATATLSAIPTHVKTIAASAVNVAVVSKITTFARTIAASTANTAALIKKMFVTIAPTVSAIALLTTANKFLQAISGVASNIASLATVATFKKTFAVVTSNIASLARTTTHFITIAITGTANVTLTALSLVEKFYKAQSARASFIREKRHVKTHRRRRRKH